MRSDSQTPPSSFNLWSSDISNNSRTMSIGGLSTAGTPTTSLETTNPNQPTNRQLSPIGELRNSTNHTVSNYSSKHAISNPLNITKTNLSLNLNNQKTLEEDSVVYGSTAYR